jgi:hypothetical protein
MKKFGINFHLSLYCSVQLFSSQISSSAVPLPDERSNKVLFAFTSEINHLRIQLPKQTL